MKNLMVANLTKATRYTDEKIQTLVKAQIENSVEVGWRERDIILLANFDFEFMGVKSIKVDLNDFCLTGSKIFGINWFFENHRLDCLDDQIIWTHDLDAWQSCWFDPPEFGDAGAAFYSRPKFNGGSIFWKPSAKDIIERIIDLIEKEKRPREEPTINEVFKAGDLYNTRVTVLNNTFNVGCSGFVPRFERSNKPIRVCHFHPYNRLAWETHALDRNGLDETSIGYRLEKLVRRYYPNLATELSEDGKKKAARLREERLGK